MGKRGPTQLAEFTQEQWGLVTRQQLAGSGTGSTTIQRMISPGGGLERIATGVYRLIAAPIPEHLDLRAAWLQLAPAIPAWKRTSDQGVVSHRSAAALYGIGEFPADWHDFTVARRKQTRRPDVRIHVRPIDEQWTWLSLPVTRPARIVADLLSDREDPEALGRLISEAISRDYDRPGSFATSLAPFAAQFGLCKADGLGLLRWLLDLGGDPGRGRWLTEARDHLAGRTGRAT